MSRVVRIRFAAVFVFAAGIASLAADHRAVTLAVTMTNDPATNQIKVYDLDSRVEQESESAAGTFVLR
jgi:hypothetical protein